jgi:hypothetical protein
MRLATRVEVRMPGKQRVMRDDREPVVEIEQQRQRLREMLALMAPETGSAALGATIPYLRPLLRQQQLLLPSPDTAANL